MKHKREEAVNNFGIGIHRTVHYSEKRFVERKEKVKNANGAEVSAITLEFTPEC